MERIGYSIVDLRKNKEVATGDLPITYEWKNSQVTFDKPGLVAPNEDNPIYICVERYQTNEVPKNHTQIGETNITFDGARVFVDAIFEPNVEKTRQRPAVFDSGEPKPYKLYRLGEFGIRQNKPERVFMKKGEVVESHKHHFDHITAVWGHLRIDILDDDGSVITSEEFGEKLGRPLALIKAGYNHRLTALNTRTCYRCIYTSRDEEGTPVATWSGHFSNKEHFR